MLDILKAENYIPANQRLPTDSTIRKYGRALPKLGYLHVEEFVKKSKSLTIGFGESMFIRGHE